MSHQLSRNGFAKLATRSGFKNCQEAINVKIISEERFIGIAQPRISLPLKKLINAAEICIWKFNL